MKNITKIILAFLFLFSLTSYAQKEKNAPERIKIKMFDVLRSMDTLSFNEYVTKYIDLNQYKELSKKVNEDKESNLEILALTKYDWEYYRKSEYSNLKDKTTKNEIIWTDVEYMDFEYTISNEIDFTWLYGYLYFKYNDDVYEVRLYAIYDGKDYNIFGLKM